VLFEPVDTTLGHLIGKSTQNLLSLLRCQTSGAVLPVAAWLKNVEIPFHFICQACAPGTGSLATLFCQMPVTRTPTVVVT